MPIIKRAISGVLAVLALAGAASARAQTLRGSHSSVDLMYTSARARELAFLGTSDDIYEAVRLGELKLLSVTRDVDLERVMYPFVLPNTHRFVDSLARAYHAACGERLVITSGARPEEEQPRNASPQSVHPTGMAVDFRKPTGACLVWLRTSLLALESRHVIEATEERHPPHFHVAVLAQRPERQLAQRSAPPGERVQSAAGEVARPGAPASSDYRVRAGDNLWTIAQRYHTTPAKLQALNGLTTSRLRVGQRLRLP